MKIERGTGARMKAGVFGSSPVARFVTLGAFYGTATRRPQGHPAGGREQEVNARTKGRSEAEPERAAADLFDVFLDALLFYFLSFISKCLFLHR